MVYILEDDDNIRKLINYSLKSQGFEVQDFALPSAFWSALQTKTPDLLLLDIMLPENVLFIMLNTNNYNVASHESLIKKAVEENAGKKWRIVTFHQDIYGSGKDHSASDGMILRTQLTTLLDKYDIDVVLQGHDHTYSRSHLLTSDGNEHPAFSASNAANFQEENLCYTITENTSSAKTVTDPKGILYMEANSSTGSKYYNLIPTQQDYIAARSQTFTPTYSVINIKGGTFTINTYDSETGKKIDEEFKIVKTK